MEYIYCKNREEYKYTMRTLKRMGYENQIKHLPYPRAINKLGVTIFVSDIFKVIGSCWRYGFAPDEYNCKENVKQASETIAKMNSKTEPLDDKEELEQDREKLRKFAKDTKGKAKITLAPMQILKDVAEVREYGVKKYGSVDSWKEVPIEDYRDALFRHLLEYIKDPNSVDNESGIKHYKHIACNLAFICEMENMEDGTRSI